MQHASCNNKQSINVSILFPDIMDLELSCADPLVCNSQSHQHQWQHSRCQSHHLSSHLASNSDRSIAHFSIHTLEQSQRKEKPHLLLLFHKSDRNPLTSQMCSSASVSVSSIDSFTPSMCSAGCVCSTCDVCCAVDELTADPDVLWPVFRPCFDDFFAFVCRSGDKFSASLSSSGSAPCKLAAFFSFTMCMASRFCCFDALFCRGLRSRVVDFAALTSSFGRSTDIRI